MRLQKVWETIRRPILLLSIPSLWVLYGLLLQVFPPILRHTQAWYLSRLAMLVVAVVFAVLSWKLLDDASK